MLFEDSYKTIEHQSEGVFKDKGSKFIAIALPVKSMDEAKNQLENIKKKYHDACHHCYAYIIGMDKSAVRFSDDGEPSNTAGKPIFNQIQKNDLTNILIVVVRYFGGTLLGVSGLINAYKTSSSLALQNAKIITNDIYEKYKASAKYEELNCLMSIFKENEVKYEINYFDTECTIIFYFKKNLSDKLLFKLKNKSENLEFVEIC